MAIATLSFVPTPSALETRIGSLNFFGSSAKSAPKLPMPPRTPLVKVRVARWRMRCLASSATAMLTPASAYFMACDPFPGTTILTQQACAGERGSQLKGASENTEQAPPTNRAGMKDAVQVRSKTCAEIAGLPCALWSRQRHVDHHGRTNDVFPRDAAPKTRVERILPIVTHGEVAVFRNPIRKDLFLARKSAFVLTGGSEPRRTERVRLYEAAAIDPDRPFPDVNNISGQSNDAFYIVGLIGIKRRFEDDDLLALRIAPEGNVNVRERNACVVPDAAHDQVIADKQRI